MVSMRKELIASLSDLEAVIVECSNQECKAQVKVPVQANLGSQRDLRLIGLIECPVCRGIFFSVKRLSAHCKRSLFFVQRTFQALPSHLDTVSRACQNER
jgi:formate dehydrogenase assembly factor FdhD